APRPSAPLRWARHSMPSGRIRSGRSRPGLSDSANGTARPQGPQPGPLRPGAITRPFAATTHPVAPQRRRSLPAGRTVTAASGRWGDVAGAWVQLPIMFREAAPRAARQAAPAPPRGDVPPRTVAVIAVNSMPEFAFHCAVETSENRIAPAIPAPRPEIANVASRTTFTRTPERRAASALPPTAYA